MIFPVVSGQFSEILSTLKTLSIALKALSICLWAESERFIPIFTKLFVLNVLTLLMIFPVVSDNILDQIVVTLNLSLTGANLADTRFTTPFSSLKDKFSV